MKLPVFRRIMDSIDKGVSGDGYHIRASLSNGHAFTGAWKWFDHVGDPIIILVDYHKESHFIEIEAITAITLVS